MRVDIGAEVSVFTTPVFVVGTYKENGEANAMTVAWCGQCSTQSVMIAIRQERCTYENIKREGAFTIHIADAAHAKQTDYFGMFSGNRANKLEATGMHALPAKMVHAPIIEGFPIVLECKCIASYREGSHVMLIGHVENTSVLEECLDEARKLDPEKLAPLMLEPIGNHYCTAEKKLDKAFCCGRAFQNINKL